MGLLFHIFAVACVVAYIIASIVYLSALWSKRTDLGSTAKVILLTGIFLHFCFFTADIVAAKAFAYPVNFFDLPHLLSSFCLLLLLLFVLIGKKLRIEALGAFLAPIGAALMISAGLLSHFGYQSAPPVKVGWLLSAHIVAVVTGTVLFFFSFAVSASIILQETLLKHKRLFAFQQKLPPLYRLDDLNDRLIGIGFLMMIIGTAIGITFALLQNLPNLWLDPLALWSELTVLVYGIVLLARTFRGWRGRRAAWLSVAGFFTIVASLVTVSFLNGSAHVY